jgi:predicted  nucleic acid-binding Zn-ribbon protein
MGAWRHNPGRTGNVEQELIRVRKQIEQVEAQLTTREGEVLEMRQELAAFRLEYDPRVGRKAEELERVEAEIDRCRKRIEQVRQWGATRPSWVQEGSDYVPVEEQYRRTWKQPEAPPPPPLRSWSRFTQRAHPLDAELDTRLKQLYRQLSRRYHPDLATDEGDRARRTQVMAAINAAYETRIDNPRQSLAELQALDEEAEYARWEKEGTGVQRLAALQARLRKLQDRLEEVQEELRALTDSAEVRMGLEVKLARRRGRDLLAEMEAEADRALARRQAELEFLLAQLRQLGIEP